MTLMIQLKKLEKNRLAFHNGFFSQFNSNFVLTTAIYQLKKECEEWLGLASQLFNTCSVNKMNVNVFYFAVK